MLLLNAIIPELNCSKQALRLIWLVYPSSQTVTVYRSLHDIRVYTREDTLSGEDVLPGFTLPLRDIFAP